MFTLALCLKTNDFVCLVAFIIFKMSSYDGIKKFIDTLKNSGTKEVFLMINNAPQYPLFSTIEAIWCCCVVRRSMMYCNGEKSTIKKYFQLFLGIIISFVMAFAPREITSNVFHKPSPIANNKYQILIFLVVANLIFFTPIFYKLIHILYYFIAMLQGFNEMRLFLRILEWSKNRKFIYRNTHFGIIYGIIILESKYIIELCMRKFINGRRTSVTTFWQISKNALFAFVYYIAMKVGEISIKQKVNKVPQLVLGLAIAIVNASAVLSN